MAVAAVKVIRGAQPTGPYTLIGYSFGCLIAFEAARILEQSGHCVERVVMLDPQVGDQCLRPVARLWYRAVGRQWSVLRWLPTVDRAERRRFLRRVVSVLLPWAGDSVLVQINDSSPSPQVELHAETAVRAMFLYRPGALAAPVTIVNCTHRFPCRCDPMPVLMRVVDPERTTLHVVDGSHPDMIKEPGLHVTAAIVGEALGSPAELAG